jgi:hypothetical protein
MNQIVARRLVLSLPTFWRWLRSAVPGECKIYHAGMLASDRIGDADLSDLADTIMVLQGTEYVSISQYRQDLPITRLTVYTVTRTGRGYAPSGLETGKLAVREYMALDAVLRRDAHVSAARAIRDACGITDDEAAAILLALRTRGLIEDASGKGVTLSQAAIRMMT